MEFKILSRSRTARHGRLRLPHSDVLTPVFMPVGTQGTMKGVLPEQLVKIGCRIILCNTYHLGHRPGHEIVRKAGGLHRFINWPYSILTDSGGFQMVSLNELMCVSENGVNFQSPHTGEKTELTPEASIHIQGFALSSGLDCYKELQNDQPLSDHFDSIVILTKTFFGDRISLKENLGADIAMQLDHVVHVLSSESLVKEAMRRSIRWLKRCQAAHTRSNQALFPIIQGGLDLTLRTECVSEMSKLAKIGIAIGGLSGGEDKNSFWKIVAYCCQALPEHLPRYVMGVGWPVDLVICSLLGADMFDCVFPTRTARFGTALIRRGGMLHLSRKEFEEDFKPVDPDCVCHTCQTYTRAYIHSVLNQVHEFCYPVVRALFQETVACHVLSVHNLQHQMDLMQRVRDAIDGDNVESFLKEFLSEQFTQNDIPQWVREAAAYMNIHLD